MAIKIILILLLAFAQDEILLQANNVNEDDLHVIKLNTANEGDLKRSGILTPLQIQNFLQYRQQMGQLLSIYELQAIPGFTLKLISELLPYITIENNLQSPFTTHGGTHTLLHRYERQIEPSRGYKENIYRGSPDHLLLRYRYNLPRNISAGVTMEKDAGEKLKNGFDFYSAHLFIRNYKKIKSLAIGDFTVNIGQGLTNWQSLAFGKGPSVMHMKREGEWLRPYASSGEALFYRGIGITMQQRHWQGSGFISFRKMDATLKENDSDITSLITTGYHRTLLELAKKNTIYQWTTGANLSLVYPQSHIGLNVINQNYNTTFRPGTKPYQLYKFSGSQLLNKSLDYAATWKAYHFFGEIALSDKRHLATIHGILAGISKDIDIGLLYRYYTLAYHAMYPDAFGERYLPNNEQGLYSAISLRCTSKLKLDMYADLFQFPWLQYQHPAPEQGQDLLAAITYTPSKETTISTRYQYTTENRHKWRWQYTLPAGKYCIIKGRVEMNQYNKAYGSLFLQELTWKPVSVPVRLSARFLHFHSDNADTRLYVPDLNMLYTYGISQFNGKGFGHCYLLQWKITHHWQYCTRFEQTVYAQANKNGSGWNEVAGSKISLVQV